MLPHEAQAAMAKILFFIFALFMVCLNRAHALDYPISESTAVVKIVKGQSASLY